MKHTWKITAVLLAMFLVTQLIGLAVTNHYNSEENILPYGMENEPVQEQTGFNVYFGMLVSAFVIAILLLFFLTKFKMDLFMKTWFFLVVAIALGLTLNTILPTKYSALIAIMIGFVFSYFKVYRQNFVIHNFTELLIYPGIAAVFVPILNIWTIIALLILISIYDMWAVWHSGIMQKMAKYQMKKLNVFSGFLVPYVSKTMRTKIKQMKKLPKSKTKNKKVKVNVAILGGGDVVFPIITAGVVMKFWGLIPALLVIIGAFLGLMGLLFFSKKKKFYPAMPFITAGIFLGMLISWLFFL